MANQSVIKYVPSALKELDYFTTEERINLTLDEDRALSILQQMELEDEKMAEAVKALKNLSLIHI